MRQQGVAVGADGVEGDIAEVEQAGEADHDVQAPAQHDVGQQQDADVQDHAVGQRGQRQDGGEGDGDRADVAAGVLHLGGDAVHALVAVGLRQLGAAGGHRQRGADGDDAAAQHQHQAQHLGRHRQQQPDAGAEQRQDQHRQRHALADQPEPEAAEEDQRDGGDDLLRPGFDAEPGGAVDRTQAHQRHGQQQGDEGGEAGVLDGGGPVDAARLAARGGGRDGVGVQGHGAYTFSISGRPSRPVGRKIRTRTRMEKVATSFHSEPT